MKLLRPSISAHSGYLYALYVLICFVPLAAVYAIASQLHGDGVPLAAIVVALHSYIVKETGI